MNQLTYESTASQHAVIREHFLSGHSLTSLEAMRLYRCMRLAAIVLRLRKREGLNIVTVMEEGDTPEGRKKWARYSLDRTKTWADALEGFRTEFRPGSERQAVLVVSIPAGAIGVRVLDGQGRLLCEAYRNGKEAVQDRLPEVPNGGCHR